MTNRIRHKAPPLARQQEDGTSASLNKWDRVGDANWRAEDGAIVADKGKGGHLASKNSYKDFQLRAEFWADHTTNSGIFIRLSDPVKITVKGPQLTVVLNGVKTVDIQDSKFASGPFSLQYGSGPKDALGGVIKWRKVQIKPI